MSSPSATLDRKLAAFFGERQVEGLVSAYLFGSAARGATHRESDVDVAVLVERDRFPSRRERDRLRIDLGSELIGFLHRNEIDLVCLQDVPPELGRRIVTEGIRVFCADHEADHAFVRDVQLRAADLDPFLRRMRAIALEALAK